MNIFDIEKSRLELKKILKENKSPRAKALFISIFFKEVLNTNDNSIIEAFVPEFLSQFISYLKYLDPTGIDPKIIEPVIKNSKSIFNNELFKSFKKDLAEVLTTLEFKLGRINDALSGIVNLKPDYNEKLSFPILEIGNKDFENFGLLEKMSISLRKNTKTKKDEFMVIPSYESLEERLKAQIITSWELAKSKCARYIKKFYKAHEIIIRFDKKYGYYIGESLGTILTIGFIEELHKLYNTPINIEINPNAVFTGGVKPDGKIKPVSKEIIAKKVKTVFFSDKPFFVIPKLDEKEAAKQLELLTKEFPNRKLELLPISSIDDILDRRKLVLLEKEKAIKRIAKFSRAHLSSIIPTITLMIIIGFYLLTNLDNNPAQFVNEGQFLEVKNESGRTLFSKEMTFNTSVDYQANLHRVSQKIFDVNKDSVNEVILCNEHIDKNDITPLYGNYISCYDNTGKLIWRYSFKDSIKSVRGLHDINYSIFLVDADWEKGIPIVYAMADNATDFPGAIFRLNAKTGKRLPGTFWNPGHFAAGKLGDFNHDGQQELILTGINNSFEQSFIMSIDTDKLNGRAPSTEFYKLYGFKIAKLNKYILLPKTDLNRYLGMRYNTVKIGMLDYIVPTNSFYFPVNEGNENKINFILFYRFNNSLTKVFINPDDQGTVSRDGLIAKGILKPPLTNTLEFVNDLIGRIKEWNGKRLVKFKNSDF